MLSSLPCRWESDVQGRETLRIKWASFSREAAKFCPVDEFVYTRLRVPESRGSGPIPKSDADLFDLSSMRESKKKALVTAECVPPE